MGFVVLGVSFGIFRLQDVSSEGSSQTTEAEVQKEKWWRPKSQSPMLQPLTLTQAPEFLPVSLQPRGCQGG